jgi:hypothetical protein
MEGGNGGPCGHGAYGTADGKVRCCGHFQLAHGYLVWFLETTARLVINCPRLFKEFNFGIIYLIISGKLLQDLFFGL